MVKKRLFFAGFLLNALLLHKLAFAAQETSLSLAEVTKLLKSVSKATLTSGQFEQSKFLKDLSVTLQTSGDYQIYKYSKDEFKVIWNIKKPEKMKVCIDSQSFVFENLLTKKKNILKLDELSQKDSSGFSKLIHLIKLNPEEIFSNFTIQKKKESLLIIPRQENIFSFTQAFVTLDSLKNLKQIHLDEKSGDSLEMSFFKTKEITIANKNDLGGKGCN